MDTADYSNLHRDFLRGLSVQMGPLIAHVRGGYPHPSEDVLEKEIEEILVHYITMEKSGVYGVANNTAFMMSRFIDPYGRNSLAYTLYLTQVFVSYFISNMRILLDKDIIKFVNPPEVEKTWKLSTEHHFGEDELADLDTWNKMMQSSFKPVFDELKDKGVEASVSYLDTDDDDDDDDEEEEND
jgi:hypothetical protein